MQQRVARLHAELQQQLHHLQVLVVDGHEQRGAAQRVHAVHVDVALGARAGQHAPRSRHVAALHAQQELLLVQRQHRHLLVRPHYVLLLRHAVDAVPLTYNHHHYTMKTVIIVLIEG